MTKDSLLIISSIFRFFQYFIVMDKDSAKGIITFLSGLNCKLIASFHIALIFHIPTPLPSKAASSYRL